MTITYVGERNAPLNEDSTGTVQTSRLFVFFFNEAESPLALYNSSVFAANIPPQYSEHPDDDTIFAQFRNILQESGDKKSGQYVVTVPYSSSLKTDNAQSGGTSAGSGRPNTKPWNLPPYGLSLDPIEVTVPFVKAYQDGDAIGDPSKPVLNPAGDPYEISTIEQNTLIKFSYNLQRFNSGWIDSYSDTSNKSDVVVVNQGIKAHRGRIRNLAASEQKVFKSNGTLLYRYWKVDVEIEVRKLEWKTDILARGLYFRKDGDAEKRYRIYTDNDGHFGEEDSSSFTSGKEVSPVDEPQKLKANGDLLPANAAPADTIYDEYFDKFFTNWKPLTLPKTTR